MPLVFTGTLPATNPPGVNTSIAGLDDRSDGNSTVIAYTGAVLSPPTGYTILKSNQVVSAVNAGSQPAGPNKTGWMCAIKAATTLSGNDLLPISSIAAGTWTWNQHWTSGALSPDYTVYVKAWQCNADLTTMTQLFDWQSIGTMPAQPLGGSGNLTGTFNPGALTFSASTPYLYMELMARVTTGSASLTAVNNSIATNSAATATIPAVSYARVPVNTITSATEAATRALVQARTVSDTITAAADTVARTYTANRTVTNTITSATDAIVRALVQARTVSETVTAAADAVSRALVLSRTVTNSITAAVDSVARIFTANRTITETITSAVDTIARTVQFNRTVSNTIASASDVVSRVLALARTISNSITSATDAVARVVQFNRTVTETISSGGGGVTIQPVFNVSD